MREFNTTGPCDPTLYYTIMRETRMAKGQQKVEKGRYFTIFAPRQAGKTTYFQLLSTRLEAAGFQPVSLSFEDLKTLPAELFYQELDYELKRHLQKLNIDVNHNITNQITLRRFFEKRDNQLPPIVLIVDEFENIPDSVVSQVMHTFRKMYHQKDDYALHSLILVGVSTDAELIFSSASLFNIADDLHLPYFNFEEVNDLIGQYTRESGQQFAPDVINNHL